jgi:hypothetical protein
VRIYSGVPSAKHDPRGYAANQRQLGRWAASPLVHVTGRALRYPTGWPTSHVSGERPQEKGIDVALAMDFAVMAIRGEYDVGILVSTDTDLRPPLELVADMTNTTGFPRAEVAAWRAAGHTNLRLAVTTRKLFCHWLNVDTYRRIVDQTNYRRA